MTNQFEQAQLLQNLHVKGDPLILFNIWDAGSAKTIEQLGAKVIATSSWAVAAANGYEDGENLSYDLVLDNFKRIINSVRLPVTIDFEGGYGKTPEAIQTNAAKIIEGGAVGINFEDQIIGNEKLYSIPDQCRRIRAIKEVAEQIQIPIFINARTDIFFKQDSVQNEKNLEEAIQRASAYAEAGASGFFVPGLQDPKLIESLCKRSPIPINIMILAELPSLKKFAELGVARISYGPYPYCHAMQALKEAGTRVFQLGKHDCT
jgi:2-methylisocitrate lyase-like PEP mutase family enzyme